MTSTNATLVSLPNGRYSSSSDRSSTTNADPTTTNADTTTTNADTTGRSTTYTSSASGSTIDARGSTPGDSGAKGQLRKDGSNRSSDSPQNIAVKEDKNQLATWY
ncbi:hypothetical protein D9C73_000078 [Collichthys lucidus]|uniref:Uncharacterized protein n=1 Tax=Collichthys lucidus TaxID=240159 RepID=A0A4V6AMR4_COLLU|nr:hypothetical protein D9C73_000078 [Collichthys lucidus]